MCILTSEIIIVWKGITALKELHPWVNVPSEHTTDSEEESLCLIAKKQMQDIILAFQLLHLLTVLVIQAITALKAQPHPCRFLVLQVHSDQLKMEVNQRIAQFVHQEDIARLKDSVYPCLAQQVSTVLWEPVIPSPVRRVHTAILWDWQTLKVALYAMQDNTVEREI
jgi:hypothetical protein